MPETFRLEQIIKSKAVWAGLSFLLLGLWLFVWNGLHSIAGFIFLMSSNRLVDPPQAFHDLCEKHAGARTYDIALDVDGIAYISGVSIQARENELDRPILSIDQSLVDKAVAQRKSDPRPLPADLVGLTGTTSSNIIRLLESYQYVESFYEPRRGDLSFVSDPGLYRFTRLERASNASECADIESQYEYAPNENKEMKPIGGEIPLDHCIKAERISEFSSRYEYTSRQSAYEMLVQKRLFSTSRIDVSRRVARDRRNDFVLADSLSFHWYDTIGGGWADVGIPCRGGSVFPSPTEVFIPHPHRRYPPA